MKLEDFLAGLEDCGYICDKETALPIYLAVKLGRPLLVEGAPGVGKTEIAKALSRYLSCELVRLQCYEGLDVSQALYEWNYQKQLVAIQLGRGTDSPASGDGLFSEDYLLERPLLRAIRSEERCVLLIDEVDKTDEEFEAFLFELLSEFQVSIPELGTVRAIHTPVVVLTSNNERELSDGLKRRCIYLFVDYPSIDKELRIIKARIPGVEPALAAKAAETVSRIRNELDLKKRPSIAETLDWVRSLTILGGELTEDSVGASAGTLFKNNEDIGEFKKWLSEGNLTRSGG